MRTLHSVEAPDGTRVAWHAHRPENAKQPALLLTTGIGTTENFWRHLLEDLTPDRHVAHWDYRAHASSGPSVSGDYSLQTQAADLARVTEAFMKATGEGAPVHVAFSMGVAVLFELYRTRPELVRAMVLIGGSPDAPGVGTALFKVPGSQALVQQAIKAVTPIAGWFRPAFRAAVKTRRLYDAGLALGVIRSRAQREEIEIFLDALGRMDFRAYLQTLQGLMSASGSDVVARVKVPVLVLAAQNDVLITPRQLQRLAAALPQATYREFADAGHAGMLEAGLEMAKEVRTFLRGLAP